MSWRAVSPKRNPPERAVSLSTNKRLEHVRKKTLRRSQTTADPVELSPTTSMGPSHSGFLDKTGSGKQDSGWKRRWVAFNGYTLKYYVTKDKVKEEDCKGTIAVRDFRAVHMEFTPNDPKHTYRILLETPERTYNFATDDEMEAASWMTCFNQAIESFKPSLSEHDEIEGGHMANPDKEGMLQKLGRGIRPDWRKRYCAVKGVSFCYYNNIFDFRDDKPIFEISMRTASVKPSQRNRFRVVTPNRTFEFQCESGEEQMSWIEALQNSILVGLSDLTDTSVQTASDQAERRHAILDTIYQEPSNRHCADCGAPSPTWASCNLVVTMCIECSGIHRSLGVEVSKVRSLELDVTMWQDDLLELFTVIGNKTANDHFMTHCRSSPLEKDSEMIIRDSYIRTKYAGAWCDRHPQWDDKDALSMELFDMVMGQDIHAAYKLLVTGASPMFVNPDVPEPTNTALAVAEASGNRTLIELLTQFAAKPTVSSHLSETSESDMEGRPSSVSFAKSSSSSYEAEMEMTGLVERDTPCFCELSSGTLRAYRSQTEREPLITIYYADMLSVEAETTAPDNADSTAHRFAVVLSTTYDCTYYFTAQTEEIQMAWVAAIKEVLSTTEDQGVAGTLRKCGHMLKRGPGAATQAFRKRYFKLDSDCTELSYHRDGEETGSIDMKKVTSLQRMYSKEGHCLHLVTSELTYVVQAECEEEAEAWMWALSTALVVGVEIGMQKLSNSHIPLVVEKCLTFIEANGMDSEGLYRISGRKAMMEKIKASFNTSAQDMILDPGVHTTHDITGVLKDYFRNLPDPLLTAQLYPDLLKAAQVNDHDAKLTAVRDCLWKLPSVNYYTLKRIMAHLVNVVERESITKMGISNLSLIFGPTLMTTESFAGSGLQATNFEFQVMSICLTYYTWVFQVSQEEIDENKKIQEAIGKINAISEKTHPVNNASQVFIVGVYVGPVSYGRTINANICTTDTAAGMLQTMSERQALPGDGSESYWPYVCLMGDDLRRPLSASEAVLPVCFAWGEDMNAKLALHNDNMVDLLSAQMAVAQSRVTGFALMRDKKSLFNKWQKRYLVLDGQVLTIAKDASSNPSLTVDLNCSYVYLGVENPKKAQPPTQFMMTITTRNELVIEEAKAFCFEDNVARVHWLASMYKSIAMHFT